MKIEATVTAALERPIQACPNERERFQMTVPSDIAGAATVGVVGLGIGVADAVLHGLGKAIGVGARCGARRGRRGGA